MHLPDKHRGTDTDGAMAVWVLHDFFTNPFHFFHIWTCLPTCLYLQSSTDRRGPSPLTRRRPLTGFKAGHHRLDSRQSDNVRATSHSCRREGRHIPNANDWASQRSLVPFFSPTNLPRCTQTVTNGRVPHSNLDVIPRTVSTSGWGAGTCHDTTSGPDRRQPSMIFSFQPIPRGFNKHHHPTAPPLLPHHQTAENPQARRQPLP